MAPDTGLTRAGFHILLALADAPRHGLGVADEAAALTDGAVSLGPGTLYRSLQGLEEQGLVALTPAPAGEEDPRRKFYRITGAGRLALAGEAAHHERLVDAARRKGVLPGRA